MPNRNCCATRALQCCSHDRRVSIAGVAHVRGGTTSLVNPGTIAGIGAPPAYVLGDLARMEFSMATLESDGA